MKTLSSLFWLIVLVLFSQCKEPCDNVDCGPNGTCIFGECDCEEGWSGERCEVNSITDPCANIDCGPNGDCVDGDCECDEGYFGSMCDKLCNEIVCINGNCNPDSGECDCEEGWFGESSECSLTLRSKDYFNLIKLYDSTGGPNWINEWNLAQSMDRWYGIKLNARVM